MTVDLHESVQLVEASDTLVAPNGKMPVRAISAGLGSSGYYSPEVLQEAAKNKLITKGTPVYFDHASEFERTDRPERSVRDISGVFTGDGAYDETNKALVGEIQVFAPYRELVAEMAPYIGLSISGSATDVTTGEVDGRQVSVIEGLASIDSVDMVTRAGRGGMFLLESVRPSKVNHRAVEHGVTEASVNDIRETLQTVLRDEYGTGENTYVWVRDFDEESVWFELEGEEESGLYGQRYATSDGEVSLSGERAEVRLVTTYVPITEESQEDTMAQKTIEESEHARLVETAGRVTALESELGTERNRADQAERQLAELHRREAARKIISERAREADVSFSVLETAGLTAQLPVDDKQELDVEAFTATVDEAAKQKAAETAELAQRAGAGKVRGFGDASGGNTDELTEADIDKAVAEAFGRQIQEA